MESVHVVLALAMLSTAHGQQCPPTVELSGVMSNNPAFDGTCQVYKRGAIPCTADSTELGESLGWVTVVVIGPLFCLLAIGMTISQFRALGVKQSSEMFNCGGRNVGAGLTASTIVSKWTWAASLLMSSHMGWVAGLSGPFWYASGATIPILLFSFIAVQVKHRASHMHTYLEVIKVRFGTITHVIMIIFALTTNLIVTSMLLLGGAATIEDVTGMSKITAALLIPLTCSWAYAAHGGLRGTFLASYVHTFLIMLIIFIFSFGVYAGNGEHELWGNAPNVHNAVTKASVHGYFNATFDESALLNGVTPGPNAFFDGMLGILQNDGECYDKNRNKVGKTCGFEEQGKDNPCCSMDAIDALAGGTYCRKDNSDCISASAVKHFKSKQCNAEEGERCVTSFLTMGSTIGLIFGITNIVGNFGTVFVDQSYWQSAIAAKAGPAGPIGFLIGGLVWFVVPFCMATSMGIAGRALTTHPDINGAIGARYITGGVSGAGLTPAKVVTKLFGPFGAFLQLLQLFCAISSTGAAEILAVSSILTYDIYYEYVNPDLKKKRLERKAIFDRCAEKVVGKAAKRMNPSEVQGLLNELAAIKGFFTEPLGADRLTAMGKHLSGMSAVGEGGTIPVAEVYNSLALDDEEGALLLRMTRLFSICFAVFMGFLATFLLVLGLPLGHVYMSMGCIVGSAVGPTTLSMTMESANGRAVGGGAVGGFIIAMIAWTTRAYDEFGEVSYNTLMADWPWVLGNLGALFGGLGIALVGSIIWPNTEFKWEQLNATIPLIDDVEPAPEDEIFEDKDFRKLMSNASAGSSICLTFFLILVWPAPMHLFSGIFSETGFVTWIVFDFIFLLLAGLVIMLLPAYEMNNVLWSVHDTADNLKLKPANAAKAAVEDEEDVDASKNKKIVLKNETTKVKDSADDLKKRIADLEQAAEKAKAAKEASVKDLQKQIADLTQDNKAMKLGDTSHSHGNAAKRSDSLGSAGSTGSNGSQRKPKAQPKPKAVKKEGTTGSTGKVQRSPTGEA